MLLPHALFYRMSLPHVFTARTVLPRALFYRVFLFYRVLCFTACSSLPHVLVLPRVLLFPHVLVYRTVFPAPLLPHRVTPPLHRFTPFAWHREVVFQCYTVCLAQRGCLYTAFTPFTPLPHPWVHPSVYPLYTPPVYTLYTPCIHPYTPC